MGPYSAILIALGGIALVLCLFQVMILFRKRSASIFIFSAVLSLMYFLYAVTVFLALNRQLEIVDLHRELKVQMILMQALVLAFIGVTYQLLGMKKKWILYSALVVLFAQAIVGFLLSEKILFGEDSGLSLIVASNRDSFLLLLPGFTVWRLMINLCFLTYLVYLFIILSISLYLSQIQYLLQIASGALILFVVVLFDQMIDLGSLRFYYLMPFGLFVNYFILIHIPFSRLFQDVFRHNELIDREKKWRTLVDHANVIVVLLNRMGHVEYVNPFFLKLTGYKESEVIGKDWFEFFVPSDQYYDVQSAFIEILEFDFHPNYRNPILTRFQEKIMIDWYNVRLRDENEQVTGSISIGVDITNIEREMEELRSKLDEAEAMVRHLKEGGQAS